MKQELGHGVKYFFYALLIVVALWGVFALTFGIRVATAGLIGRGNAEIQIESAPYRISAYDHFFNQCASIQGLEGQIDELTAQLDLTEPNTRAYNLTMSSLTGVKAMRHSAIAQYNADASKDYTVGQFRDSNLPYRLMDSNYPNGSKTVCASF
jgi:hypothetical protein